MTTKEIFDEVTRRCPGQKVSVSHVLVSDYLDEPEYWTVRIGDAFSCTSNRQPSAAAMIDEAIKDVPTSYQRLAKLKAACEAADKKLREFEAEQAAMIAAAEPTHRQESCAFPSQPVVASASSVSEETT